MSDYDAHRRLSLLFSPGVPLLAAGVVLHGAGWRGAAWLCLLLGTVATALFLGNLYEFLFLRRWRRRRCPACGSAFRVDGLADIGFAAVHRQFDDGACRHAVEYVLTCAACDRKFRFDSAGTCLGSTDPTGSPPSPVLLGEG